MAATERMDKQFSEIELLNGLKVNDSRAYQYVFDKYYAGLTYFTFRIIVDWEEARDIVIQVFNTFWNLRDNFDKEKNIKAFLYVTARNKCLDFLRYRERQSTNRKEYSDFLSKIQEDEEIEARVVHADLVYKIYIEVQKLPQKYREIVMLTYFKGMSANEIADELNISVSNVTTRRARALDLLRLILKRNDELLTILLLVASLSIKNPHL